MKKGKYAGKTFTTLLKDLKVKPKDILVGGWNGELVNKNNLGIYMYLFLNDGKEFEDKHFIVVHFNNVPTDFDTINALCFQSEKIDLNKVFDLYKNTIVSRVSVKDYTQN
ncbi:hypothetical protein GCM10022216_31700 [Sphingobacterium kyonggiense]|uniref:Uncharacterized protein n=2 Tax=Sphingobacteriaceae TaxID=84566 RepID=A0ABP7Z427_9SPHI